jgi:hypothetical protein
MSAWPTNTSPSLHGAEGELVSVRIAIQPRLLERVLDLLAGLEFPINPQLYHDAATISVREDGQSRAEPATIVEFPAWSSRLAAIGDALARSGLDPVRLTLTDMLDDIHAEPAPLGARKATTLGSRHTFSTAPTG